MNLIFFEKLNKNNIFKIKNQLNVLNFKFRHTKLVNIILTKLSNQQNQTLRNSHF